MGAGPISAGGHGGSRVREDARTAPGARGRDPVPGSVQGPVPESVPELYQWSSSATVSPEYYPVVIMGSLLAVLPLVLAFVLLQRFWRGGLTAGAVK